MKEKPLPAQLGEIIGGYELVRVLSHGGMGCVYQAVHVRLKRPAAVKVLATALLLDEELVARFFREARVVNEVRHPNIVDIIDFVELEAPRRLACVMEYLEGPTLKQVVREKRFSVVQAINATKQLVSALHTVHALNVIHRDLKPNNIIVTGDLRSDLAQVPCLKVLDFGIAKVEDSPGEHKTASGTMLGTPAYMAPEQVAADSVSAAADIYALGELLYEMVSGRRAFPGSRADVLKVKMTGHVPALPLPEGIRAADAIRELVTRCIAHDPKARPSLEDFEKELAAIEAFSLEDRGLEIIDADSKTDRIEVVVSTDRIELPPMEEAKTTIASISIEREVSEVSEPSEPSERSIAIERTDTRTIAPPRPKRPRWIAAVPVVAIAMVAIPMAMKRDPPPKPIPIAPKPMQVLAPVTLQAAPRPQGPSLQTVQLASNPSATVVDAKTDARLGKTPLELTLAPGATMELMLIAPGRKPQSVSIDGKRARVSVELEREKKQPKKREKRTAAKAEPTPARAKGVEMPDW